MSYGYSIVFLALICFISLNFTCHIDYFYSYCCIEVCVLTSRAPLSPLCGLFTFFSYGVPTYEQFKVLPTLITLHKCLMSPVQENCSFHHYIGHRGTTNNMEYYRNHSMAVCYGPQTWLLEPSCLTSWFSNTSYCKLVSTVSSRCRLYSRSQKCP